MNRNPQFEAAIKRAKCNYFRELFAPYITDSVLDTKRLKEADHKLYEEFKRAFKGGIRIACAELGIYPSRAAKKRAEVM